MATAILVPAATNATSSDVVVAAGATAVIGIYTAAGQIPQTARLTIVQDTPGSTDIPVDVLDKGKPSVIIGAGTFRVVRVHGADWSDQVGAFSEP